MMCMAEGRLGPPSLPGSESTPSITWPGRASGAGTSDPSLAPSKYIGLRASPWEMSKKAKAPKGLPGWLKHGQGLQWDRCIFFLLYIYVTIHITLHNYIDYSCIPYIYSVVDTKHEILNNMRLQLAPLKPREVSRLARVDTMEKELPRVARPLGRSNWVKQLAIADGSAKEKSSGSAEGKKRVAQD